MRRSDTPSGGLRQTDDSPDDVTEAIVELIKQRKELRERRAEVEPDTREECRIDSELRGLAIGLDTLSEIDDWDLPEWSVGVENFKTEEWDWYSVRAARREKAVREARSTAREELGDNLNVYEVYGPMATDGGERPGDGE